MAIQVFRPVYDVEGCIEEIRDCLEKGWTGMGYKTVEFEKNWCEYTKHKYAHFLNSATAGLHLAVKILQAENSWEDGDEIITSPLTFVSTNHAILYENLCPVFADVDATACISPEDVKRKLTNKTRAIIFVGYGGSVGHLSEIVDICKKNNIKLILDAAHMSGTTVNGIWPGTWESIDVAVYSFQAVKNLPTADSGMICFAAKEHDELCRKLSWLGINKDTYARTSSENSSYKWRYDVEYVGYKYHGNSIMAAIGIAQLKRLEQDNEYRRHLCELYESRLTNIPHITFLEVPFYNECSRHIYAVSVPNRDELVKVLHKNEIYPGVHYINNMSYKMYACGNKCIKASELSDSLISLPLHLELSEKDITFICDIIKSFLA